MSNEKRPIPTAFTRQFAADYENWSGVGRHYEALARALASRIREASPDARNVLEIGTGTGNSAAVLLEQLPDIILFGAEPGEFLELAVAKWRNDDSVANFFNSSISSSHPYSEEIAQRLAPHRERLYLLKETGEKLSFVDESLDAIAMCQVFHWFKESQDVALEEMRRVLKPGGIIVFDESGAQFDFGSSKDEQELNGRFIHFHPFARLFRNNLNEELLRNGHEPITVPSSPGTFSYQFTQDSLQKLYAQHGFEFIPTSAGSPYSVTYRPDPVEKIIVHEKTAHMRLMASSNPLLRNPEYVDEMIERVMHDTLHTLNDEENKNFEEKYGATAATFVARKNR